MPCCICSPMPELQDCIWSEWLCSLLHIQAEIDALVASMLQLMRAIFMSQSGISEIHILTLYDGSLI